MHYLGFDLETGGLDKTKHSIMEAYFVIYDENERFIEDLYLKMKPDDGVIVWEQEAIEITKIDPFKHAEDPDTLTYSQAREKLMLFLNKHKIKGKRSHYKPTGQNIEFDLGFIWEQLIPKEDWDKLVSKAVLDTYRIITFLKDTGSLPQEIGNLSSLAEYFGIPLLNAHGAKDDTIMAMNVYFALKNMQKMAKKDIASSAAYDDIFEIIEE
jgi:DNA polymerase III alpha subunit (gram-positive type)